jgi:hypothetical protein
MKLTKKILNENRIFNPHDIARITGEKVYIAYSPQSIGRMYSPSKWQIVGINIYTDPTAHWTDHKTKTFDIFNHTDKLVLFETAKAWVKEKYGMDMTERDVWGNWHVTGTMDKMKAIIQKNT